MNAQEIIEYIRTSEKKTPVKVYVWEKEPVEFPDCQVFPAADGCKIVFGDWKVIAPILQARQQSPVLVSMAAGVRICDLQEMAGGAYPLIRIMPNIPVSVGEAVILYATPDISAFRNALSAAGLIDPLPEALIDAGSALSGCGPAFVSLFIEALADGAVACGLTRQQATNYACQTLIGTARMLQETGMTPGALKDAVCSPGGSTIAGVAALAQGGLRAAAMQAVDAAFWRTKELGK